MRYEYKWGWLDFNSSRQVRLHALVRVRVNVGYRVSVRIRVRVSAQVVQVRMHAYTCPFIHPPTQYRVRINLICCAPPNIGLGLT